MSSNGKKGFGGDRQDRREFETVWPQAPRPRWRGSEDSAPTPWRLREDNRSPLFTLYLILSYAAAKSPSGIGIAIVSFDMVWNDIFSCLPDFRAASMSAATGVLA